MLPAAANVVGPGTSMNGCRSGTFDNRDEPLSQYPTYERKFKPALPQRLLSRARGGRRPLYSGGTPHLLFKINRKSFVYPYIRKNACTSFKHFLSTTQPDAKLQMGKLEGRWLELVVKAERELHASTVILILREPLERICSLFRNKFVQRSAATDISHDVRAKAGLDPLAMTFEDFVLRYLRLLHTAEGRGCLDRHVMTQAWHLWPIRYDVVVMLSDLGKLASELFGQDVAAKYFVSRRNAASDNFFDGGAADVPAENLRARYNSTGQLPGNESLLTGDLTTVLREIYEVDFALIERSNLGG